MVSHRARIKCKTEKIVIRNNEIAASTKGLGVILKRKVHLLYIKRVKYITYGNNETRESTIL